MYVAKNPVAYLHYNVIGYPTAFAFYIVNGFMIIKGSNLSRGLIDSP